MAKTKLPEFKLITTDPAGVTKEVDVKYKRPTMAVQDVLTNLREEKVRKGCALDLEYRHLFEVPAPDFTKPLAAPEPIPAQNKRLLEIAEHRIGKEKLDNSFAIEMFKAIIVEPDIPVDTDIDWDEQDIVMIKEAVSSFREMLGI